MRMIATWVRRSLRYYGTRHLVFAGTVALTAAILCAALLTGESLQAGLRSSLHERLGTVRTAVHLAEGLFPSDLARRLPDTQAALLLKGELLNTDGALCARDAQILGVVEDGASHVEGGLPEGLWPAVLNARGHEILPDAEAAVRFEKPARTSAEIPLGAVKESRMVRRAVRLEGQGRSDNPVEGARPPGDLLTRDFALRPAAVPPVNLFLPFETLARDAGVPGEANLLVSTCAPLELEQALAQTLTAEDAGLLLEGATSISGPRLTPGGLTTNGWTQVKSRKVFLQPGVRDVLANAGLATEAATFHLADTFEAGTNATPYGFVAALTPDGICAPRDLKDDEIVINAWLAATLGVTNNQTVTLRWRRFEAGGRLVPESRVFRVRAVVTMEVAGALKHRMPVFPGLEGVDSCAAWDVGLPMDEEKLKDAANEAYWKQWRETPKAVLTFAAGTLCFGTVFGEAMSLRVAAHEQAVRAALASLTPAQAGFVVRPMWAEGLKAAQGTTDFRLLFVGMAFVLMGAALLLSALSLALALETRKGEVALLSALGWGHRRVVFLWGAEWCVPLVAGALSGAGAGALLARVLVWSLGRFWRDAFVGAETVFHFSWPVTGLAVGVSAALTLGVLVWRVWRFAKCRPVELWQTVGRERSEVPKIGRSKGGDVWGNVLGGLLALAALAMMVFSPQGAAANGVFFGAGFLLMLSLLLFLKTAGMAWFARDSLAETCKHGEEDRKGWRLIGPVRAGVCRALQVPRRSAPVVILLAVGTFLTVGILSMKHDPVAGCERPSSGSGGFAALVTSVTAQDRVRGLDLARQVSGAAGVVPVRVREGDEAGCLNMNVPQTPRLLGLDARAMARARAFEPENSGGIWTLLERPLEDGAVPALAADQAMLQYSLKAKAGVTAGTVLAYTGAAGTLWRVRIVGVLPVRSGILQGALIVDERFFVKMFPEEGYRLWLCDYAPYVLREAAAAGGRRSAAVAQARHPAPGVTVETVEERLRLLGSVESAYLDMFLVLGGLGVVLGVFGVALVILRGVQERRGELALLSAVGLPRGTVVRLLGAEYGTLVLAGLATGVISALVAIQPAARALRSELPWGAMAGIIAALFGCAAACVGLAARAASRRYGPAALKEEV